MMIDRPVVFLDIDGVLNDTPLTVGGPHVLPRCAKALQALLAASGAELVITSSWGKWINDGSMTLKGLERLLRTHGIHAHVVGHVISAVGETRAFAIRRYILDHDIKRWIVLDDMAMPLDNFVKTNGDVGLTCADVLNAYRLLRDGP